MSAPTSGAARDVLDLDALEKAVIDDYMRKRAWIARTLEHGRMDEHPEETALTLTNMLLLAILHELSATRSQPRRVMRRGRRATAQV